MSVFQTLVRSLRRTEQQLQKQLNGIRTAISSLEFGSAAVSTVSSRGRGRALPAGSEDKKPAKKRRKMSAAARAKIAAAQKARWAKLKAGEKKK